MRTSFSFKIFIKHTGINRAEDVIILCRNYRVDRELQFLKSGLKSTKMSMSNQQMLFEYADKDVHPETGGGGRIVR